MVRRLPFLYETFSRCRDLVTHATPSRVFIILLQPPARHDLWEYGVHADCA